MKKNILMKSLLQGICGGVAAWLIYGLLVRMIIEHRPIVESLFSSDIIILGVIVIILDTVATYFSLAKKAKKGE